MSTKQKQLKFHDYQFTSTKDEAFKRSERYIHQFLNKNLLKKKDGTLGTPEELLTLIQQANINLGAYSSTSSGSTMGAMLNHTVSTINLGSSNGGVPNSISSGGHTTTVATVSTHITSHHHSGSGNLAGTATTGGNNNNTSTTTISITSSPTTSSASPSQTSTTTLALNNSNSSVGSGSQNASDTAQIDIEFHLSYTQLVQLPQSIFNLVWIQKLVLTHHNIKTLSEDIGKLQQLQVLILENNRLISLPQSIGDLVNLKRLEIDNNHLVSLCSLERLSKLEVLSVNNNKLTLLPTSIASLTSLKTLNIKQNPIITPPSTVISKGLKDIVSFLRELETGARPCLRSKLVVLGDPGVGKTSVIQCIKGKKKKQTNNNVNINNNGSEIGIEIDQYDFDIVDEDDKKRRVITLSTWDIANQDVYFSSSQLFDSERSVYIVVFSLNNDDFSAIEYWLHCIMSTSPNSPIVLVGTHIDEFENLNVVNAVLESVASRFQKRFSNIQAIISVSCTTGYDVDKLRQLIEEIIKAQPYLKEKVPSSFFTLEEALIEVKKKRIPPVMMWQEYINLANICNLKDSVQIQRATEFLHNIGSIVYFNDLNSSVGKMVILDQQWIINCMSSLITSKVLINNCNGIVRQSDLELVWKAPTYPEHLHSALLSIMQAFEICRPLSPSDLVKPDEINDKEVIGDRNLVPNLLSDNNSNIITQWDDFIDPDTILLNRQYHLPFLPEKFFGKLIIHLMNFTKVESCYKRVVVVRNNDGHEALIELKTIKEKDGSSKKVLTVDVRGMVAPVSLLRIVTDTIESLFSQWYKLNIKRYISCYECAILYDRNPTLFTIEECEFAVIDGKTVLTCHQKSDSERVSTSHRLKLDILAPDISMVDIPIPRFDLKEIKISKEVGRGAFGIVYEAEWRNDYIALKKLLLPTTGGDSADGQPEPDAAALMEDRLKVFREFRHEVYSMSRLNHPNVMKISGFCIQPLCMALEYVRYGSLYSLLSNNTIEIGWGLRLQIAIEIAKGMQHLHSHNPPVIHRDLKSPNVLLNGITEGSNNVATIIDFGTSTALYGGAALIRCVDQPLWLAPEVLACTAYSEPSDVYSFGIILWELYTRAHPFDEFSFGQWMSKLEDEIIRGLRPTIPSTCPPEYVELIQSCWTHEPNSRPTFTSIVEALGQIKKKFAPLPFTHPPHIRNMMRKSRSSSISEAMLPSNLLHLNLNGINGGSKDTSVLSGSPTATGTLSATMITSTSLSKDSILSSSLTGRDILNSSRDNSLLTASSLGNNTSTSSLASLVSNNSGMHHSPSASENLNDLHFETDTIDFFQDIFTEEENEQPYPFADDDQQKGILFGFDEEQQSSSSSGSAIVSNNSSVSIIIAATMAKMIEMMTKGESSATIKSDQIATRRRSDTAGKNGVPHTWRNSVPLSTNTCTTLDETFIDDFIYVYRSFATPRSIFKLLVRRFFGPRGTDKVDGFTVKKFEQKKQAIRQGIAVFLRKWVADITELEFRQDEFWLYHNTVSFNKQFISPEFPNLAYQINQTLAIHEDEVNLTNQRFLQIAFSESELNYERTSSLTSSMVPPKPFRSQKNLGNLGSPGIDGPLMSNQSDISRVFLNLATGMRDPLLGILVRERKFKKDKVSTICCSGSEIIDWITKCMPIERADAKYLVLDMLMKQFFIQLSEEGLPIFKGNPNFSDSPTSFYMFLEDDPELVARQFTFLELKYLHNIHPRELLGFSVGLVMPNENEKDPEKWRQSNFPHIYDYFKWFNKMTMLVSTEILRQRDIKQRAITIEKYISVALEYLSLWNFNGIMQVLSSLHSEPISRLTVSWSKVSQKYLDCFHDLSRLMLPESNYLPLRSALAQKPNTFIVSPAYPNIASYMTHSICPTVPFLGALIADLSQTCTENPTFISSGGEKMINILRVKRLSKKMKMFKEYKEMPTVYSPALPSVPLQYYEHYVNELKALDHLQLDRLSEIEKKLEIVAEKMGTTEQEKENDGNNNLTGSNFFGSGSDELTERDWTILLTNASVITYSRGDVVMEENAINTHLYRIKSGAISVEKKDKDGLNVKVATMLAPKMFGEMSFLGNKTTARLTVEEESDLYVMDIPFLNNLFNSHPRLGAKFYKIMANQLAIRLKNLPWSKPKQNGSNSNNNGNIQNGPDNILGTTPTGSGGILTNQNLSNIISSASSTPPASPRGPTMQAPGPNPLLNNIHPTIQHRASSANLVPHPSQPTHRPSNANFHLLSGNNNTPRGDGGRSGSVNFGRTQTSTSPLNENFGGAPVMKKNDQEFCQRFSLEGEIVIKDYPCSLNRSGRLYISQQHVCFYSKFFGYKTKKVIPFKNIDNLICVNVNQLELTRIKNTVPSIYRLTFQNNRDREDAFSMIQILHQSSKQSNSTSDEIKNKLAQERKKVNNLTLKTRSNKNKGDELTKEDWELIGCEGSRSTNYKKDEVIIREGERMQKIFQIGKGVCRIEKSVPIAPGSSEMKKVVLGTMKQDDTFGEITYLLNGETTADVISDSDQTEVYTIEGQFVNILFDLNPALASKWFKYLATALNKTLIERESQLYA
ncbi:cGMP binding protein with small GTPase-serine/threonine kinase-dep-rasgef-gram-and two cGMP binding domains [Dictyostelium purpureum]|uniref:non-specific serine/threonine protein kinase n=1 Tax=Dictyostelium purpureum TaxID=5786 RepID=F0ZTF5_DICPU|nr:cGMP binding protein with small GTPase-serine/threonine kinase-dep-rasgef-gram-and two cGMP binding domains [Dictyostelium purpureum]EGC32773.1 cGMP binding protein with small GTPase-serine/threonine kinase-dep-rasgef-gram-and two cGMP binding domains [Dictyostelium purpureum]|eukprot:XP_003290696.1 cGMP binding protein with small GTPase-serine/threonine kinase-dep-rasgef-gram-and two cGMP binding domains [Dictyostelium purpureum]